MDQAEFDDEPEDEQAGRTPATYTKSLRRNQMFRRLVERVRLIAGWILVTIWPGFGWRAIASMILITCGRLADAASFVVGTHILTRAMTQADGAMSGLQWGMTLAAAGMAGVLGGASILSYLGNKLAVKLVLEYEDACVVEGLAIVRHYQEQGTPLTPPQVSSVLREGPRQMSRSLLQVINACTSLVMMASGLSACLFMFPVLTGLILLTLLLISPLYIFAAIHSTNVGHGMRVTQQGYRGAMKRFEQKWMPSESFDKNDVLSELRRDPEYTAFQTAYKDRLRLNSRNHLLTNLTLALVIALSFIWIANEVDLTAKTIASVVSYLVSLRLFAHGLAAIFQALQGVNALLPYFLPYLLLDPRIPKPKQA